MENLVEVSIDKESHIVIPASLQHQLGLSPGDTLIVEKGDNDEIYLRVLERAPELVNKGGILVVRAKEVGDLSNVVRNERDRRLFELLQRVGI
ncbi:MAG: AbrB/MazE/SpoVT family DNA-binding domain-containing protein [Chloroflexi bacterium]|nr:AbrB/MazE/SpoVT family DNA-binding domain-containing protein [Chloroflexota bacterium]